MSDRKYSKLISKLLVIAVLFTMCFAASVTFAQAETTKNDNAASTSTVTTKVKTSSSASKISLSNAAISISKRQVKATGKTVTPKIKSVVVTSGKQKITVPSSAYVVKYLDSDKKEVKKIVNAGKYTIVIEAKKTSKYKGEAECPFTVIGTPQKITIDSTDISLKLDTGTYNEEKYQSDLKEAKEKAEAAIVELLKSEAQNKAQSAVSGIKDATVTVSDIKVPSNLTINVSIAKANYRNPDYTLNPVATGDGTGFKYKSDDKSIVKVDNDGNLFALKKGETRVSISTVGSKMFHPAKIYAYIKVE